MMLFVLQMDAYDYERLLFVCSHGGGDGGIGGVDMARTLLLYLQSYERVAPPTQHERDTASPAAVASEEEELLHGHRALSPLAATRLPFHPFLTPDPWKILSKSVLLSGNILRFSVCCSVGLNLLCKHAIPYLPFPMQVISICFQFSLKQCQTLLMSTI